ncbi:MAG: SDR family NAD(P)-dependent oxidoreductase [Actinomycetales bacterium]|nr:SDR family NAD(P)-dependent oxidoreductase [Actinomycetales bacterium]
MTDLAWDPRALPRQDGRRIVITGATAGIGYFAAEQLAAAGADVVLAARSQEKTRRAIDAIRDRVGASVTSVRLDLASLDSVRRAADELAGGTAIDALVNNAGLVIPPGRRRETEDGLELLVGGNFVGHFALTARLWGALAPGARVVGLGSMATRMVRLDPDDLMSTRRYRPFRAYGLSKHAVHGFGFELDRRLRAAGSARTSVVAHPGYAVSELADRVPGINDEKGFSHRVAGALSAPVAQGKDHGAWPVVRGAIDRELSGGEFLGPGGLMGLRGAPTVQAPAPSSADPAFGARLWALAEAWSGERFDVAAD